ncbi:MAG: hypothetical protein CM1200mP41_35560 [Gammaproteobacteria bacterium]|nr:MAG: hypothetical protein CM1200mP41_35560 [Gammaproteobacteria bacterium]
MVKILIQPNRPLACNVAILALVPVPQGERSSAPFQVSGRFQSREPVDTTAAFLRVAFGFVAGPESTPMVISETAGFSGCYRTTVHVPRL